jgi:putative inorganic carbon (HCO3(-)) transporter
MSNLAKTNNRGSFSQWLRYNFFTKKFNTPAGYILIGVVGVAIGISGVAVNTYLPVLIGFGMAGILFVVACFYRPVIGFYASLIGSALLLVPDRLLSVSIPLPMGLVIEALEYLTLLAIIAKQYRHRVNIGPFWRYPLTIVFLVLLAYYVCDIFNPVPHSTLGWFNYTRKQLSFFAFYYMAYILFDSYKSIIQFLKVWFGLALFIAVYGIKQQWFGLTAGEINWLYRNPESFELAFQSGFLRKFSILNDPAVFGLLCAAMLVFTLTLAVRATSRKRQWQLGLAALAFFLGSSYSGTRSCNLMIVAGVFAYTLFTLNEKRTYTIMIGFLLLGGFLLYGPFRNNPVVVRISSTFQGNKDPSAMIRTINRHRVQPYIRNHPMGGGIFTCGVEGAAYNKGHFLWNYPPDSGYMKILAEQGWIGLFITLIFYFIVLRTGVTGYFHAVNPKIKTLYLALTICLFSLLAGQFAQIALAQYPTILFYFPALIILYKLKDYDTSNPETNDNSKQPA